MNCFMFLGCRTTSAARCVLSIICMVVFVTGCAVNPEPIPVEDHLLRVEEDRGKLYTDQEPLTGALNLSEAIARALKYNFDHKLNLMEASLQDQQLSLSNLSMLPKLAANAGYSWRDNTLASYSVPVSGGNEGALFTSNDRERSMADLSFSWNILDFGVSYYQAKQQADRVLMAREQRRRVVHNILREVGASYWRAATAQRVLTMIDGALTDAEAALDDNRKIEEQRLQPIMKTLQARKDLLETMEDLRTLQAQLFIAKTQLAAMINLPPGSDFKLEGSSDVFLHPKSLDVDIEKLEDIGLFNRPDLREAAYMERIDKQSIKKEMLRILPGISLTASTNYDSNQFLMNNNWAEAGVNITANILDLPSAKKRIDLAKSKVEVSKVRRLALSVAAIAQINISFQQYQQAMNLYKSAEALSDVEDRLQKAIADAGALKAESQFDSVRQATAAITARMEKDMAKADTFSALCNLYVSMGLDPYQNKIDGVELKDMSAQIRTNLENWHKGELPELPVLAQPADAEPESDTE